jgi:hypothetical protein
MNFISAKEHYDLLIQEENDSAAKVIIQKTCNLKNAIDLQQLDCVTRNKNI